jgi:hypothetical protein
MLSLVKVGKLADIMAISDDIRACLNEEAEQVLRPLQAEGYVRRRVFREGDDTSLRGDP